MAAHGYKWFCLIIMPHFTNSYACWRNCSSLINKRRSGTATFSIKVVHINFIEVTTNKFFKKPSFDKSHLDGTLFEEVQPMGLEKFQFELWKKKREDNFCMVSMMNHIYQHFVEFLENQGFDAWFSKTEVPIENCCARWRFSIEILMEEVKPVATEKDEFGYQDKLVMNAILEYSIFQDYYARNKIWRFAFHLLRLPQVEGFTNWEFD